MNTSRACLQGLQLLKLSGSSRVAAFSSFRHGQILTKVGNQLTKCQSNLQCIPLRVSWRQMSEGNSSSAPDKPDFDKLVKNNKVVVFMKGVPDEPRCGFSNAVVQIMRMHGVTNYDSHNVLADENIRQGIKEFTNWPTIPQVFINGEFVGGCDILIEMHKSGELVEQLGKVGIKSALLEEEAKK